MKKKITVIGGSGFVGTNLCKLLEAKQQDFEIIDLKLSNQFPDKCKIGDVREIETIRQTITGDVVVNLAATHRDDVRNKSEYQRTNIDGAENVALVCEEKGIKKIVFTSTVAVYGFAEPGTDETGVINPFNEYGRSKFEAEEKLRVWQAKGQNALLIVRPTVIFGEGNRGNVYNLLNQVASGKFVMVGKGKNKKSMAYIDNVVAFLEASIATNQSYGVYNYVDTPDFTMEQLVSHVRFLLTGKTGVGLRIPYWLGILIGLIADVTSKLSGLNLPISSIRIKKFRSSTEFKSAKHKLDGFEAKFSLQEGLNRTLENEFLSPNPNQEIFHTE
ncbi:NAD-dependent epimerase/dehydratase family protein [Octadecabacter sp.]|nr:NAD-dependent epimerase/dehydratase family protein [Octadecabacter sp.]